MDARVQQRYGAAANVGGQASDKAGVVPEGPFYWATGWDCAQVTV